MALVEETAAYLDGPGRQESKKLARNGALAYATESMRLTTRLMQLASWLLLHRAVKEGEMSLAQANKEKSQGQARRLCEPRTHQDQARTICARSTLPPLSRHAPAGDERTPANPNGTLLESAVDRTPRRITKYLTIRRPDPSNRTVRRLARENPAGCRANARTA